MKDGTGREFNDKLTHFLTWYLDAGLRIFVPHFDFVHFVEGVTGLTIYRDGQYQVQLFTATPNTVIPSHTHPNVDSYEVALSGMEFFLDDKVVLPRWYANLPSNHCNLSTSHYEFVRVLAVSPPFLDFSPLPIDRLTLFVLAIFYLFCMTFSHSYTVPIITD